MGRKSNHSIGDRYGGLEILEILPSNVTGKHVKLKCLCTYCNNIVIKNGVNIRKHKSCGCQQRNSVYWESVGPKTMPWQLKKGEAAKRNVQSSYKKSAKRRNYEYSLTDEQFTNIISENCFYCGDKETSIKKGQGKTSGNFYYTGIDRIDNSVGYVIENCVPCCWKCNIMKHVMSKTDFINHIKKIFHHQQNYKVTNNE